MAPETPVVGWTGTDADALLKPSGLLAGVFFGGGRRAAVASRSAPSFSSRV